MTDFDLPDPADYLRRDAYRPAPAYEPPGEPVGRRGAVRFDRVKTTDLMRMEFEPIRWIVPEYVPEGFSVLAGRQKLGKTWLALDWALAVACGGFAMGAANLDVEGGDVLYIDCENGARRIQRRIASLYPDERDRPDLSRLEWVTDAPALDKGFLDALDDWRHSVASPRLVVIDVLQRIKPVGNASRTSYENDYSIWSPLQRWATDHGIAVVGLHHTKKGGADDPLEALSGSNGLSACADATIVLDRNGQGITLYVRGRDTEEKETALRFDAGRWMVQGDASEVRKSIERHLILKTLHEADAPMSPNEIAVAAEMKRDNATRLLSRMAKDGEVIKAQRGFYIHSDRTDLRTADEDVTAGPNGPKVRTDAHTTNASIIPFKKQIVEPAPAPMPSEVNAYVSDNRTVRTGDRADQKEESAANNAHTALDQSALHLGFMARAKAIVCATGEGRQRRLTPDGKALLVAMLGAGLSPRIAGPIVGVARQNAERIAGKMEGAAPS